MSTFTRFEEMEAWRSARALTKRVYQLSSTGAFSRDYALRDQMRRAAISVMSNIAEGCDSRTNPQFIEYLGRARASAGELRSQFYIALDLEYLTVTEFKGAYDQCDKCSRQISRLILYLERIPAADRVREAMGPEYSTDFGHGSLPNEPDSGHEPTSND